MSENVYEIISEHERKGDFTYADVTNEMLAGAERRLGVELPVEYGEFLKYYGHGGIGGIEVLGVGKNGLMIFENETSKYRTYGMPRELIAIENCDEWVYCINTYNNRVVMWSRGRVGYLDAYGSFEEYLRDRVNDILENM